MRYQACVISKDAAFSQFIYLTLLTRLRKVCIFNGEAELPEADIYVVDLDTCELPRHLQGTVLCCSATRDKPRDFPYLWVDRPFRPARMLALLDLSDSPDDELYVMRERQSALVAGEEISLSSREYALLRALYEAKGEYVTREALLKTVWGDTESDPGVVNVYIHYLRRKLERGGHRFIASSRGLGYALKSGGAAD